MNTNTDPNEILEEINHLKSQNAEEQKAVDELFAERRQ